MVENYDKRFNLMEWVVSDGHAHSIFSPVYIYFCGLRLEAVASPNNSGNAGSLFWSQRLSSPRSVRFFQQPLFLDIKYYSANCADSTSQYLDCKWRKWLFLLSLHRFQRTFTLFLCVCFRSASDLSKWLSNDSFASAAYLWSADIVIIVLFI